MSFSRLTAPSKLGGGKRDRTADLLRARQALSQLSYTPWLFMCQKNRSFLSQKFRYPKLPAASQLSIVNCQLSIALVGLGGLEPPTSRLSGVRSDHLSYKPSATAEGNFAVKRTPESPRSHSKPNSREPVNTGFDDGLRTVHRTVPEF